MSLTASEFMARCTQLGFTMGPIGRNHGLVLNALVRVLGETTRWPSLSVQAEVTEVIRLMTDLVGEVPWEDIPHSLGIVSSEGHGGEGNLEKITVVGTVTGVEGNFLEAAGKLARNQHDESNHHQRLIAGFKAKVEEEVEADAQVIAARVRIAEAESEVSRRKGDLLAIQAELRSQRADSLEPYLYVVDERELKADWRWVNAQARGKWIIRI